MIMNEVIVMALPPADKSPVQLFPAVLTPTCCAKPTHAQSRPAHSQRLAEITFMKSVTKAYDQEVYFGSLRSQKKSQGKRHLPPGNVCAGHLFPPLGLLPELPPPELPLPPPLLPLGQN